MKSWNRDVKRERGWHWQPLLRQQCIGHCILGILLVLRLFNRHSTDITKCGVAGGRFGD